MWHKPTIRRQIVSRQTLHVGPCQMANYAGPASCIVRHLQVNGQMTPQLYLIWSIHLASGTGWLFWESRHLNKKFPQNIIWTKIPYGAMKKGPSKKREMNYNWRASHEVCIDLCPWTIFKQQASPIVKSEQLNPWALLHPLFLCFPSVSNLFKMDKAFWTSRPQVFMNIFWRTNTQCVLYFSLHMC